MHHIGLSRRSTHARKGLFLIFRAKSQLHGEEKQGYRRREEAAAQGLNDRQDHEYQNQYRSQIGFSPGAAFECLVGTAHNIGEGVDNRRQ